MVGQGAQNLVAQQGHVGMGKFPNRPLLMGSDSEHRGFYGWLLLRNTFLFITHLSPAMTDSPRLVRGLDVFQRG